jgi:hypothetical protein
MGVVNNDILTGLQCFCDKLSLPANDFALTVDAFCPEPFPYLILIRADSQLFAVCRAAL